MDRDGEHKGVSSRLFFCDIDAYLRKKHTRWTTMTSATAADMDRSIMTALGLTEAVDTVTLTPDDQRDYLAHNTPRMDEEDVRSVYRIAYLADCARLFRPQGKEHLAINLDRIPDDIIRQMYLQAVIFLDRMKNTAVVM